MTKKIIDFDTYKRKKELKQAFTEKRPLLTQTHLTGEDLSARMVRISRSLDRINQLMDELREKYGR